MTDKIINLIQVKFIVKSVKKSARIKQIFIAARKTENLPEHSLQIDNDTRWSGTYIMIERFLEQKEAIKRMCMEVEKFADCYLNKSEWDTLDSVCHLFFKL